MQTHETTDLKEVKRLRIAQFTGRSATLDLGGTRVTGMVRAMREVSSGDAPRWIVSMMPDAPRPPMARSSARRERL